MLYERYAKRRFQEGYQEGLIEGCDESVRKAMREGLNRGFSEGLLRGKSERDREWDSCVGRRPLQRGDHLTSRRRAQRRPAMATDFEGLV